MWPVRRQTSDSRPGRGMDRLTLRGSLHLSARPCGEHPGGGRDKASSREGEGLEGWSRLGGAGEEQSALGSRLEPRRGLPAACHCTI